MRIAFITSYFVLISLSSGTNCFGQSKNRQLFTDNWKFILDSNKTYESPDLDDSHWRTLNLPHDWSIELPFDSTSPTGTGGGALRGGTGWYRKTFTLPASEKNKMIFIDFDGI